jgi:hypothetical protein
MGQKSWVKRLGVFIAVIQHLWMRGKKVELCLGRPVRLIWLACTVLDVWPFRAG